MSYGKLWYAMVSYGMLSQHLDASSVLLINDGKRTQECSMIDFGLMPIQ